MLRREGPHADPAVAGEQVQPALAAATMTSGPGGAPPDGVPMDEVTSNRASVRDGELAALHSPRARCTGRCRRPRRRRRPGGGGGSREPGPGRAVRGPEALAASVAAAASTAPRNSSAAWVSRREPGPDRVRVVEQGARRVELHGDQRVRRVARVVREHRLLRGGAGGRLVPKGGSSSSVLEVLTTPRKVCTSAAALVGRGQRLAEEHRGGQAGRLPARFGHAELERPAGHDLARGDAAAAPGQPTVAAAASGIATTTGELAMDSGVLVERGPVDHLAPGVSQAIESGTHTAGACPRSASARGRRRRRWRSRRTRSAARDGGRRPRLDGQLDAFPADLRPRGQPGVADLLAASARSRAYAGHA